MPELPEVQAVVDSLQQLKNKKIESIDIRANVTIPVGQNFIKNLLTLNMKLFLSQSSFFILPPCK